MQSRPTTVRPIMFPTSSDWTSEDERLATDQRRAPRGRSDRDRHSATAVVGRILDPRELVIRCVQLWQRLRA